MTPKRYKAQDTNGNIVEGWYVLLHLPETDKDKLVGYKEQPCLFNDEPNNRKGCYWHEINPDTLQEIEERQMYFDFN